MSFVWFHIEKYSNNKRVTLAKNPPLVNQNVLAVSELKVNMKRRYTRYAKGGTQNAKIKT
ncbi:hypothetical protein COV04_03320 [Candidatus Uhrbacteria bacterium CG10_big_fil_rev_8_21_14_0_10_48_11]|uniref:Uncharacterized protein n=1 Tax=Candidatus Uhrbacteria bacterium CG10_big_fil_rev_8_21_14_0_10_48_11 TaxID=1975037 RepID=A0A2M8LE41_9BACT|nr:MAG: hypothetical protein COV04_03320 [Candidatus Uhrbacteria bacterium CG10_big_fil_rev_8_21_14_0_10_48_11]